LFLPGFFSSEKYVHIKNRATAKLWGPIVQFFLVLMQCHGCYSAVATMSTCYGDSLMRVIPIRSMFSQHIGNDRRNNIQMCKSVSPLGTLNGLALCSPLILPTTELLHWRKGNIFHSSYDIYFLQTEENSPYKYGDFRFGWACFDRATLFIPVLKLSLLIYGKKDGHDLFVITKRRSRFNCVLFSIDRSC